MQIIKFILSCAKIYTYMAIKKKVGRPKKSASERTRSVNAYITGDERARIENKYGNITKALRKAVLPKCG